MMDWKNKRVFISGGSGVIGTALVNLLIEQGASLFIGDLKPNSLNVSELIRYREGDLITLNKEEIREFSPEFFFHLAATFERSTESADFWHENFHHNILLSHHLLDLQKDLPSLKKIIFASSYLIYNSATYLFPTSQENSIPLNENEVVMPRNLCGMAKFLHEQELLFIKSFRPDLLFINARIFRSYGKNSRDIISRWIKSLLKKEQIEVYCPENRFDFVFAEDVAKALMILAETNFSGTVNVGSGKSRSINEVLEVLKQSLEPFPYLIKEVDLPYEASQADITLLNQIAPRFTFRNLEEVIPELISFEKKQQSHQSEQA